MKKEHTGFRDKLFRFIKSQYLFNAKKIISVVYFFKEKRNFKREYKLDKKYKKDIKKYWKKYNINVGLNEFEYYYKVNSIKDCRYITKRVFHSYIEPNINDLFISESFQDKNYLDLLLKNANVPYSLVRNINGTLLNHDYEIITINDALNILSKKKNFVFKPSIDSGGGRNIIFISEYNKKNILQLLSSNKNYVIQEVIKQHKFYSSFNESSVNTVRVLSFLFKGEVHILYMVLRIGKKGSKLDNASSGGTQIVIDKNGIISNHVINIHNDKVYNSDIVHGKLPFYDDIVNEIRKLHPYIAFCPLVGWDVTVDTKNNPVIVEINLSDIGMTDKSQALNGPLFGDMTDEVLLEIKNKIKGAK